MPQAALTDGELLKKTLRTTLVMVGSTAVWLGILTSVVMMSTSGVASEGSEGTGEKGSPAAAASGGTLQRAIVSPKNVHRGTATKIEAPPHPGDPI